MNLEELLQTHPTCSIRDRGRVLYYYADAWEAAEYLPGVKGGLLYRGPDLDAAIEAMVKI